MSRFPVTLPFFSFNYLLQADKKLRKKKGERDIAGNQEEKSRSDGTDVLDTHLIVTSPE